MATTTTPVYGKHTHAGSLAQLAKFTSGRNSAMANFLLPICHQDTFFQWYDFDEDVITTNWSVSNSSGSGASDFAASTSKEYGAITGTTGTTSNGTVAIKFDGQFFDAKRNPGMLIRFKFDIITSMYFECGFMDVPTNAYTINWAIDTPTLQSNATTDVASIVIDTSATQKSAVVVAHGTTDTTSTKAVLSSDYMDANGVWVSKSPGLTPLTAGVYTTALIQIAAPAVAAAGSSSVTANINGNVGLSNSLSIGLDTAIPLRPYVIAGTRNTAAKVCDIDYIAIWCDRV